jgi:hypothetical protein
MRNGPIFLRCGLEAIMGLELGEFGNNLHGQEPAAAQDKPTFEISALHAGHLLAARIVGFE